MTRKGPTKTAESLVLLKSSSRFNGVVMVQAADTPAVDHAKLVVDVESMSFGGLGRLAAQDSTRSVIVHRRNGTSTARRAIEDAAVGPGVRCSRQAASGGIDVRDELLAVFDS